MEVSSVFTPNDVPTVTYVDRADLNLEGQLSRAMNMNNMVISLSGPSKSGKTVLIKKIIDESRLVPVVGSGIIGADDLWRRALEFVNVRIKKSETETISSGSSGGTNSGISVGIPSLAKLNIGGNIGGSETESVSSTFSHEGAPLVKAIEYFSRTNKIIFIDDFHYIKPDVQEEAARQIKVAAENGVKIITASVPHKSDDVVRSNPELMGRVAAIDIGYWGREHLLKIVNQGFDALNISIDIDVKNRLSDEAMGSPQLMQAICHSLCESVGIESGNDVEKSYDIKKDQIDRLLLDTSRFADFSRMLSALHAGPRTRGQDRMKYNFIDGTTGDVYRSVLLAMKLDPISMSFTYDGINSRVKSVCTSNSPTGSSISACLDQMNYISESDRPKNPVISWDGDRLDITDPYFAFFLRCSDGIIRLAENK